MTQPRRARWSGARARLLLGADLGAVLLFATEGAAAAAAAQLDLLGITVVAFVAALGGGILRDLLLGAVPPAAIADQRYPAAALLGALAVIPLHRLHPGAALAWPLVILDALGLALGTVAGTEKAIDRAVPAMPAAALGVLTGVGGGVLRDVLLSHVPLILRADFYATAALAGAAVLILGRRAGLAPRPAAALGFTVCLTLRLAGAWLHWHLPTLS